jgi:hypothetical protein
MKKTYTQYLVVKTQIEVDCSKTDQNPDDHFQEIVDTVASELDYDVKFSGVVEVGGGAEDIPVKITTTEVVGLLDHDPT